MCKTYVLNTRTMVYHTEHCHYDDMILKENYIVVDKVPTGATPCSKCLPQQQQTLCDSHEVLA